MNIAYTSCLPSVSDRARWAVAQNSTDNNKATPLIFEIWNPFLKLLLFFFEVEDGMNAEWDLERGEHWFICMPASQQAHGFGRYCKFAIVLSQSSHMGFEMTDLVAPEQIWDVFTGLV